MTRNKMRLGKELSVVDGFLILLSTFLFMNLLVGSGILPVKFLADRLPGSSTSVNMLLVQQVIQSLVMVGLIVFFLRLRDGSLKQIGLRPFRQRRWIGLSFLFGIATFFVMLLVTAFLVRVFPQWAKPQAITELIMQAETNWEWFAIILIVCVLAPFSEELLFRGYIYHSLRQYKTMGFSIIMTSLLFGCMHYDLFRLLPLTLVGVCLNLVSIRSGTLWGSILMHGTWNFMMTVLMMTG